MAQIQKGNINSLRKHRKMMGYTLKDVAWLLNLKCSSRISRWERGVAFPNAENLIKLGILYRSLADRLYAEQRVILREELLKRQCELHESSLRVGKNLHEK